MARALSGKETLLLLTCLVPSWILRRRRSAKSVRWRGGSHLPDTWNYFYSRTTAGLLRCPQLNFNAWPVHEMNF